MQNYYIFFIPPNYLSLFNPFLDESRPEGAIHLFILRAVNDGGFLRGRAIFLCHVSEAHAVYPDSGPL